MDYRGSAWLRSLSRRRCFPPSTFHRPYSLQFTVLDRQLCGTTTIISSLERFHLLRLGMYMVCQTSHSYPDPQHLSDFLARKSQFTGDRTQA